MQAKRLVVTALVCGFLVVCASAARVQALPKSIPVGSSGTTADKPQSKLWYHDGSWWGILPYNDSSDPLNDERKGLNFYRLEDGVFDIQTFAGARVSTEYKKMHTDVLWDGPNNRLFVLVYKKDAPAALLHKYEYNAPSYQLMSGFPVSLTFVSGWVPPKITTPTIAKDSLGKLWIVYIEGDTTNANNANVRVIWSTSADHISWSTHLPTPQGHILYPSGVKTTDIAAIEAFNGRIGVMWSNLITTNKKFGFTFHLDTDSETTWSQPDMLPAGPPNQGDGSDNHIHLTVTPDQKLLAVTKSTNSNHIHVRVREVNGAWSGPYLINSPNTQSTRPIVLYEQGNNEVYVFYQDMGAIPSSVIDKLVYKKAKLSALDTLDDTSAITIMSVPGPVAVDVTDVTSTKDPVDTGSSIVVAAKGGSFAYYTSIVMHAQTETGVSTNSDTVASADLIGKKNHLYLAAIATTPPRTVSVVEGLGLDWDPVAVQCSGKDQTEVAVWRAYGTPTGNGPVTATLAGSSTDANAVIAVSRYSGVDVTTNPIGNVVSGNTRVDGVCDPAGGTDTANYSFVLGSLPSPIIDGAVLYGAVAMLDKSHTEGPNFTERKEVSQGSGSMTAGLAVEDKPTPAAGSDTVRGTFSGIVDWAGIAIELRPPHD